MRRSLIVLGLLACGKSSSPPEEQKHPDPPRVVAPAKPSPPAITKHTLEVRTGAPFALKKGAVKAFTTAGGAKPYVMDNPLVDGRVIIATQKKHNIEAESWTLVDLATGKTLATFQALYDAGQRSKKAIVDVKEGEMAVLDQMTGALHVPTIELPTSTVAERRIVLDDARDIVWVFAKGADGNGYVGRWSDFTTPVKLAAAPFYPTMISNTGSVVATAGEARESCNRYLVSDGAPPACEPAEGLTSFGDVLADRYWLVASEGTVNVFDQKTKSHVPLIDGCTPTPLAYLPSPPRLLAGCRTDTGAQLVVWSPDKTWTGSIAGTHHHWLIEGAPLERTVVIPSSMMGQEPPYRTWLDVETATMFDGPALTPLTYGKYGGLARRFVARGEDNQLWWVDLAAGTIEQIAADLTCAHDLQSINVPGAMPDRVLIRCGEETSAGVLRKPGSWTEVIDGKARTRTRIDDFAADYMFEDGRAIGITLTGPKRVAVLAR